MQPQLVRPSVEPQVRYTVPEAISLLKTSRSALYKLIAAKQLAIIKQGRRTYIPGAAIIALSTVPS